MIHPGPRAPERVVTAPTRLIPISGTLRQGGVVMEEVAALFAAQGAAGGVLWLDGLACDPMRYVLPALSSDGLHAAWYSETHAPQGPCQIQSSTAMVGWRDGAPFLHCHGIWTHADGSPAMGHLLPFDSVIAESLSVRGLGTLDASLVAHPDAETAFTLFRPEPVTAGSHETAPADPATASGLLVRILPGEDVVTAIEAIAALHDISDARLHGIGSIDHVRFTDGSGMDCLATELRLSDARLSAGRAAIGIDVVDIHGTIASGQIERGANPVGVTLELLIEPLSPPSKSLEGQK